MSEVKRYTDAMMRGDDMTCGDIEQQHGVYGLPPDLVTVVLAGVDAIADRDAALAELENCKLSWGLLKTELAALKGGQASAGFQRATILKDCNVRYSADTAPPAQASAWVAEGWRLVPVEPTEAMVKAAAGAITTPDDLPPVMDGWSMSDLAFRSRYQAALAAAPTPGASDGKGGE